jgi:hypothetical protein
MTAVLTKDTLMGRVPFDTQSPHARQGQTPEPTEAGSTPNSLASARAQATDGGHFRSEAHPTSAPVGSDTDSGHCVSNAHNTTAAVGSDSEQGPSACKPSTPKVRTLADPALAFAADILDDLERTRNANANRLRIMTTLEADADGVVRGFGLDERHPDVARLSAMVTTLDSLVHDATLNLQRQMRRHPLGPWAKAQRGIGEKQAARLLAAVGDPYWNTLHNRPRTVSELWAYCGLHTLPSGDHGGTDAQSEHVAARRTKGQKSNWSTNAKTRAWLCVESCMKQIDATCKSDNGIGAHVEGCKCSPYRVVIDQRRTRTAETHPDWTPGHSLNDAMRIASKALLRDLWREAKRIHEEQS